MNDWKNTVKESIRTKKPYSSNELNADVKLDQNESPYDIPVELKEEICRRAVQRQWNRYPDISGTPVREALAKYLNLSPGRIVAGVGSDELLLSLSGMVLNKSKYVLVVEPTFQMYRYCADVFEAKIRTLNMNSRLEYPVEEMLDAIEKYDPGLIFIASPNNPTGGIIGNDGLAKILEAARGLVVLDEAYGEFSPVSGLELQSKYRNLVITRTFSKALSMAGLRLGFIIADPEINSYIYRVKNPFSVNIFTETAAVVLLEHPEIIEKNIRTVLADKERFELELKAIPGVKTYPSRANFMLLDTARPGSEVVRELVQYGILVRDMSSLPLLENCVRVSVGTEQENKKCIEAMKKIFTGGNCD